MKRKLSVVLLVLLSITMLISMTACADNAGASGAPSTQESSEQMEEIVSEASAIGSAAEAPDAEGEPESEPEPETEEDVETVLIAYYSHSNNTAEIARQIHELVGGDLFQITPVEPYPQDYEEHVAQVREEIDNGYLPSLSGTLENIDSYEVIYIGYPMWYRDLALPVKTFINDYDLFGKTIIPFCTHEGTGAEESTESLRALLPSSTILDLFDYDTYNRGATGAQSEVTAWLDRLGVLAAEVTL